jgi:hypothetical protein
MFWLEGGGHMTTACKQPAHADSAPPRRNINQSLKVSHSGPMHISEFYYVLNI